MKTQIVDPEPADWAKAVCRTHPDDWYSEAKTTLKQAKYACNTFCPLRDACLVEAMKDEATWRFGVRGGLTARERRLLARGRT